MAFSLRLIRKLITIIFNLEISRDNKNVNRLTAYSAKNNLHIIIYIYTSYFLCCKAINIFTYYLVF